MSEYETELGQMVFGCPHDKYEVPQYGIALLEWVMKEIGRVYWNTRQSEWNRYADPQMLGVTYRPYYWGDDEQQAALPNFVIQGNPLEIRWYKHCWRGVSCNIDYTPDQWVQWFDSALKVVHTHEASHD